MGPRPKLLSSPSATDQAAAWFARRRSGSWSEADASNFVVWLKADSSHTKAWDSYERLWSRLEAVQDDPKILTIRESARRSAARREALRRDGRFAAAAAAGIVLGVAVWWSTHTSVTAPVPVSTAASISGRAPNLIRDVSTEVGERSVLLLPDGSKVTLNTASAVHTDYTGRERRVTLVRGEAFFDVARDHTRPFVVSAGARQVIAVGTAFDIRMQERRIKVTLVQGKVRVVRSADPIAVDAIPARPLPAVELEAGSALVAQEDGDDHVERLDAARATSWTSGKLVFDGERLADVVAEMNRYSREKLEIADPELKSRRVSGVFEPTSGPAFATALETYGIARVAEQTTTTIILDSPH
jgi:transmembrane sensor